MTSTPATTRRTSTANGLEAQPGVDVGPLGSRGCPADHLLELQHVIFGEGGPACVGHEVEDAAVRVADYHPGDPTLRTGGPAHVPVSLYAVQARPPLISLALANAVGDRVKVGTHHVQLVGLEVLTQPGPEGVLVAVVELDDDLADAVGVDAPCHVERATAPLPISSLQLTLPSVRASCAPRLRAPRRILTSCGVGARAATAGRRRSGGAQRGGRRACWRPAPP